MNNIKNKKVSTLNKDLIIKGDIVFNGSIDIEGSIFGDVSEIGNTHSLVIVQKEAEVRGKIDCSSVIVKGNVFGDIHADNLKIEKGSLVVGNCIYKSIQIHSGARLTGGLFIKNEKLISNFDFSSSNSEKNLNQNETIKLNAELSHYSS